MTMSRELKLHILIEKLDGNNVGIATFRAGNPKSEVWKGAPINAGDRYTLFFVKKNGVWERLGPVNNNNLNFCDLCGKPILKDLLELSFNSRFCCDYHGDEFIRREEIDAEENTFYGREN